MGFGVLQSLCEKGTVWILFHRVDNKSQRVGNFINENIDMTLDVFLHALRWCWPLGDSIVN